MTLIDPRLREARGEQRNASRRLPSALLSASLRVKPHVDIISSRVACTTSTHVSLPCMPCRLTYRHSLYLPRCGDCRRTGYTCLRSRTIRCIAGNMRSCSCSCCSLRYGIFVPPRDRFQRRWGDHRSWLSAVVGKSFAPMSQLVSLNRCVNGAVLTKI